MLTVERVAHSGAYVVTALVKDKFTPFNWYETHTFYGYQKREVSQLFRQMCKDKGYTIIKD